MHYPYKAFLTGTGLTVHFLRIDWYTTALNRAIVNWSTNSSRIIRKSFDLGVYLCLVLAPISLVMLVYSVVQTFNYSPMKGDGGGRTVDVEILVPGVTLPFAEIGYYVVTLLVCTVVHELGHALASVLEDVPLNGFGIRLLFIIPMAYTDLAGDALDRLRPWRKMRILCAGIWHNMILGLLCYLLFVQMPTVVKPFFRTGAGVYILGIDQESPLFGARGLQPDDVIVQVNRLPVTDIDTYTDALLETLRDKPRYCVSSDWIHNHDESTKIDNVNGLVECCDKNNADNFCFEHFIMNGMLEMPPFMCLNIRRMIESSGGFCDDQDNCNPGFYCIKPLLGNHTTIIQLKRAKQTDVLYLGHPGDIYKTTRFSRFIPKSNLFSSHLAEMLNLFLKYMTVFSFGLVFVNVLPCYGFDGQAIICIIIHQMLAKFVRRRRNRDAIAMAVTILGSFLMFLLMVDFFKQHLVNVF